MNDRCLAKSTSCQGLLFSGAYHVRNEIVHVRQRLCNGCEFLDGLQLLNLTELGLENVIQISRYDISRIQNPQRTCVRCLKSESHIF